MPGTPDPTGRAAELGRFLRERQALTEAELAEVQSARHSFAVEVAVGGYWPTLTVPLLLERGPDCVPAIDTHATRALDQRPRPFEGTILLWARHQLTGEPHPAAFDALLDRDLHPTAPAPKIADATRALLEALPIERREALVLDGARPRWAWIGTCPTATVAEAAIAGLACLRSTAGNDTSAIDGAVAMGPVLRSPLEAALNRALEGNRAAWTAVLAKLGGAEVTLTVLEGDPDPEVRAWARFGLGRPDLPDSDPTGSLEALYARALQGEPWDALFDAWFDEQAHPLADTARALLALHRRDPVATRPAPYGWSIALDAALRRLGPASAPLRVERLLSVPPDGRVQDDLRQRDLAAVAGPVAASLASRLGSDEVSAHDARLFDWLARDAGWTDRAVYERGLDHPDPRVRAVCRRVLHPVAPAVPDDPFEALPALLAQAMAPCRWGGFECRLFDRETGRLYAHSNELDDPPDTPAWVDLGPLDQPDWIALFAATPHDELRTDTVEPVPTSWERARDTLDRIYASERDTHLGTEIDAALDRLIAAFQALDLEPLAIRRGVYQVAHDHGIALSSVGYLGVYWYLNDQ